MLEIRAEQAADADAIRRVNLETFGGCAEADLVEALRATGTNSVSLVVVPENSICFIFGGFPTIAAWLPDRVPCTMERGAAEYGEMARP